MSKRKLSIITTTYNLITRNQKSYFYEMFRSIHEQDYPSIEHIIVDGGSKDGSVEFIKGLIEKYGKKEVVLISEKDKGINDATNKGYRAATSEYITLMCDDDFYTRPDAVSLLMNKMEETGADYAYGSTWWLNREIWYGDENTFAWRHPFLINCLIFKKSLIEGQDYLDIKYPIVADYDFFMRLLKQDNIKGAKVKEVLTILRPGGVSQSNDNDYIKEMCAILEKHFNSKYFKGKELWQGLHGAKPSLWLLLKIHLFCKNEKIKKSVFSNFTFKKWKREFMIKLEHIFFLKFITKYFRKKKRKQSSSNIKYSISQSRKWIETFYSELF